MTISFNPDEVFEIAEQIEKKASFFYKEAAEKAKIKDARQMFLEFSAMEAEHARMFAEMRTELSQTDTTPATYDPDGQVVLYLKSYAEAHGWEGKMDTQEEFTGQETPEEVLHSALRAEKDSVAFYVGIKDMVMREAGKQTVEKIIKEEMKHIGSLTGMLNELKK